MQDHNDPAIRITLLPRDTNSQGTIFGGVILSYIDTAGAIEAHRHTRMERFVTVVLFACSRISATSSATLLLNLLSPAER